jgi:hypothetical protein
MPPRAGICPDWCRDLRGGRGGLLYEGKMSLTPVRFEAVTEDLQVLRLAAAARSVRDGRRVSLSGYLRELVRAEARKLQRKMKGVNSGKA